MNRPEPLDTIAFNRINRGDIGRWVVALIVVAGVAGAGTWMLQNWSPPVVVTPAAEPAILLDLVPAPVVEPAPPEPEIAEPVPPPEPAAVEPSPAAEPEPPAVKPPPVEPQPVVEPEPIEPAMTPEPVTEPEPEPAMEPEPMVEPEPLLAPEPSPEPVPDEPAEIISDVPTPVTMSAELRQQREQTPTTGRRREPPAQEQAEPRQQPEPAPEQAQLRQAAPTQPSAPAESRVSIDQWQSQVIRQLDRNKIYPGEARQRGEQGAVEIMFSVDSNGRVSGVGIAGSSGFPALDQAAIDTARAASPLPAPPEGLAGQSLSMVVRFTLR